MPTLQFKGKTIIWNHHLSIPYHTLEEVAELNFQPDKGGGNLIVEGDNLLALKALLPQYAGKVKCIYIDPPYNTGNEHWVYNDNVNSPLIKEWLGKEVGKDDLTRHDKWLCMMVPRLRLLRDLLSEDGTIFVSIDDNEAHSMRFLLDEIFGGENFVACNVWQKRYSRENREIIGDVHEYIIVYARSLETFKPTRNLISITDEQRKIYRNPNDDPNGPWRSVPMTAQGFRPNQMYKIRAPQGAVFEPPEGRCWSMVEPEFKRLLEEGRIYFGKDNNSQPNVIRYLSEVDGVVPWTWWPHDEVGHTDEAKKQIRDLLGESAAFDTAKPVRLITRILEIASQPDSIILDSFAGSGTTMHAVMEINQRDGGTRRCITVQMTEADANNPQKNNCRDITRKRVENAIRAHSYDSGFRYLRVGRAIDAESLLAGDLPTYEQFAKYVFYLCTGEHLAGRSIREKDYFVAEHARSVIYLIYRQDIEELTRLALNLSVAEKISAQHPGKNLIVYAPACFLDEDFLDAKGIQFVNIPYGLFQKNGRR